MHAASLHIEYPMLFKVENRRNSRSTHCGVLEFIADEGMVYMPYWVRNCLFHLVSPFPLCLCFACLFVGDRYDCFHRLDYFLGAPPSRSSFKPGMICAVLGAR